MKLVTANKVELLFILQLVQCPISSECLAIGKITFLYLYVQVPVTNLQSRSFHSVAAITLSPGMAEVVLFGGTTALPATISTLIAETTVLRFGKYAVCMTRLIKALV